MTQPAAPPAAPPQPYDRTTRDGRTVDRLTDAALRECERRLGYPLTVVQGSYHRGVLASAGTHDGGGVVDLLPWDWQRKVRVLRSVGFAAWHRPELFSGGRRVWGEHIHAVLIGNTALAPVAARQVAAYRQGRDGLAGNRADPTWRPDPIPTFAWPGAGVVDDPPATVPTQPRGPGLRVDGVDLSHWNTVIDVAGLSRARDAGVRFVYHKATEGTTVTDEQYAVRRGLVRAAGLPFGGYHFARPAASGGRVQARHFLTVATPAEGDLRCMLDLEDDGGLGRARLTEWVRLFVQVVTDATGRPPLVYTPFDLDDACGCDLWVARYHPANRDPVVPRPWAAWRVRQFSNGRVGVPNRVPGLGAVDLNTLVETPDQPLDWYLLPAPPA